MQNVECSLCNVHRLNIGQFSIGHRSFASYHSDCPQPYLYQRWPLRDRRLRAPQSEGVSAVRVDVDLGGNSGLLQGGEVHQRTPNGNTAESMKAIDLINGFLYAASARRPGGSSPCVIKYSYMRM